MQVQVAVELDGSVGVHDGLVLGRQLDSEFGVKLVPGGRIGGAVLGGTEHRHGSGQVVGHGVPQLVYASVRGASGSGIDHLSPAVSVRRPVCGGFVHFNEK